MARRLAPMRRRAVSFSLGIENIKFSTRGPCDVAGADRLTAKTEHERESEATIATGRLLMAAAQFCTVFQRLVPRFSAEICNCSTQFAALGVLSGCRCIPKGASAIPASFSGLVWFRRYNVVSVKHIHRARSDRGGGAREVWGDAAVAHAH